MIRIAIFILIAIALIAAGTYYNHRLDDRAAQEAAKARDNAVQAEAAILTKLEKTDVVVGTGDEAKNGDTVEVNYVGTLTDGTKFDSSYDRKQTFSFTLGAGNVIKGWDLGVLGMKVGGKRNLVIPPELAYGTNGAGNGLIPPNSTLKFTVELVSIKSASK